jgi:rare lipoprotein A
VRAGFGAATAPRPCFGQCDAGHTMQHKALKVVDAGRYRYGTHPYEWKWAKTVMARLGLRECRYHSRVNITFLFLVVVLFLHGCAGQKGYKPEPELTSYKETGIASYYARKFQNRKTASGERLNNNSMTAAHKTLPFGTKVTVKNVNNGKSVQVTINDRGPFVKGRVIDLTRAAFSHIANLDEGLAKVEISVAD